MCPSVLLQQNSMPCSVITNGKKEHVWPKKGLVLEYAWNHSYLQQTKALEQAKPVIPFSQSLVFIFLGLLAGLKFL